MRHHRTVRKFGRTKNQRNALLTSLAEALIVREKILTSEARAKELRGFVEPLITRGKNPTLAARRTIISKLQGRERVAKKVIDVLSPRYKDQRGGYTRVTKVFKRSTDARKSALIEFV